MIWESWQVVVDEVAGELKINNGSVHIIHRALQYQKLSIRLIPKLICALKECGEDICETHL